MTQSGHLLERQTRRLRKSAFEGKADVLYAVLYESTASLTPLCNSRRCRRFQ